MNRPNRTAALLLAVLAAGALAGCGSSKASECSAGQEKADIHTVAADWYLWKDELATVDAGAFDDPSAYLDALTAGPRADKRDRHFSYLTTKAASSAFFDEGENLGYGFGLDTRGTQLFVAQTFPSSAVSAAGLSRGDELVAIATEVGGLGAAGAQVWESCGGPPPRPPTRRPTRPPSPRPSARGR